MDAGVSVSGGVVDKSDQGAAEVAISRNVEAGTKINEVISDRPVFGMRETKGKGSTGGLRIDALANDSIGKVHRGANLRGNIGGIKSTYEHRGG